MKKILFLISIFSHLCFNASAQQPIEWQRSLGSSGNDRATSFHQTSDGGYIIAGGSDTTGGDVTINHGDRDYWIVKLSSTGTIQWQKSFGGSGYDGGIMSVDQTTDGGYIVAGSSSSTDGDVTGNHGQSDYWIVKLTGAGFLQWQKSFGGSERDEPSQIQQTSDGGYIVAGYSSSTDGNVSGNHGLADFWIIKLNNSGILQWEKSLGGSGDDKAYAMSQTADGGFIVSGYSISSDGDVTGHLGFSDYWIVKLNGSGAIQWEHSYGGSGADFAFDSDNTNDGGYIVAGYSSSDDSDKTDHFGNYDYWIIKLSVSGDLQWQRTFGGSGDDFAFSVQQTSDGGYVLAGNTVSNDSDVSGNHGINDYWIMKLNTSGNALWEKCIGGSGSDFGNFIEQTDDGGYITGGFSDSQDGDVTGNHGDNDCWIVKLSSTIVVPEITTPEINFSVTPNPVSGSAVILFSLAQPERLSVSVIDITGRLVETLCTEDFNSGEHELKWNPEKSHIKDGIYFIRFTGRYFFFKRKIDCNQLNAPAVRSIASLARQA